MLKKILGLKNEKNNKIDYFDLFKSTKWHEVQSKNSSGEDDYINILEKDGKFISVIKILPINTDFLTLEDLENLTEKMNILFNSLTEFSIYIYKEPVDYSDYIKFHEEIKNKCSNIVIEQKQDNFIKYVKTQSDDTKNNKVFYMCVSFDSIKMFNIKKDLLKKNFNDSLLEVEYLKKNEILKIIYKRIYKSDFIDFNNEINEDDLIPQNAVDYKGIYQIIEGRYHKQLVISNYSQQVKQYSWLNNIFDFNEEINITINCKWIPPNELIDNLDKQISKINYDLMNKSLKESEKNEKETMLKNSQDISKNMMSSRTSLFDTEIIIDIEANSEEGLTKKTHTIKNILKSIGLLSMEVNRKRFSGFTSTLPINSTLNYMWNLTSQDIASLIPFDSNSYFDDKGIIIGKNPTTQIPYSVNLFDSKYFNPHIYILGISGSGKTYAITTIIERMKPLVDTVIKFDIAGVLHTSDSKRYIFSSEGNVCLNPFYIRARTKKALNSATLKTLTFFTDVANFSKSQIDLIAQYIKITYLKNGLKEDGFSDSYKESTFTDFAKVSTYRKEQLEIMKGSKTRKYKESEFESKKITTNSNEDKEIYLKLSTDKIEFEREIIKIDKEINDIIFILSEMNSFIHGAYSKMFNGKNSFEYEKDTVLDLSKLDKAMVSPVYKLLANDTWQYCIKDGTRDKNPNVPHKIVVFDEEHEFIDNEVLLKTISKKFSKQGRKYGICTIHASQDFNDTAQNIEAQAILSNCNFKIVLRIGDNDFNSVKNYFRFSDKEMKEITGSSLTQKLIAKGRGIFVVDNLHLPYQSEASKLEHKEITEVLDIEENDEENIV